MNLSLKRLMRKVLIVATVFLALFLAFSSCWQLVTRAIFEVSNPPPEFCTEADEVYQTIVEKRSDWAKVLVDEWLIVFSAPSGELYNAERFDTSDGPIIRIGVNRRLREFSEGYIYGAVESWRDLKIKYLTNGIYCYTTDSLYEFED